MTKPASKDSIQRLVENMGQSICSNYQMAKEYGVMLDGMTSPVSEQYKCLVEFCMTVSMIQIELCTMGRALFRAKEIPEKKFYLKNIKSSVAEAYKVLLNRGKKRKNSLWMRLGKSLNVSCGNNLRTEAFNAIVYAAERFEEKYIDKKVRDLTYHYDDDMMNVYDLTVAENSEEDVAKLLCGFLDVLQQMLVFYETWCPKGINYREGHCSVVGNHSEGYNGHALAKALYNKDGKLDVAIMEVMPRAVKKLDAVARLGHFMVKLQSIVDRGLIDPISGFVWVKTWCNIEMLFHQMFIDLLSVLDAYIHETSEIGSAFNLRRAVIIKVSVFSHLCGYNEDERETSWWKKLKDFIPASREDLKDEYDSISMLLDEMLRDSSDKKNRNDFVHCDLTSFQAIEEINPFVEMESIIGMLKVFNRIHAFVEPLSLVYAEEVRKKNVKSRAKLNEQLNEMTNLFQRLPEGEEKTRYLEGVEKLRYLGGFPFTTFRSRMSLTMASCTENGKPIRRRICK
jgi:hypothetical protein